MQPAEPVIQVFAEERLKLLVALCPFFQAEALLGVLRVDETGVARCYRVDLLRRQAQVQEVICCSKCVERLANQRFPIQ